MATATSAQSRKKKTPGLMDQIGHFFGGEKKKRSKGSFRGHLAASPQQSSARRRTNENAVLHFFRSFVSLFPLLALNPDGETCLVWPRRRVLRTPSRRSEDAETKARCPDSSAWEKPSPAPPPSAGAPSSELCTEARTDPMEGEEPVDRRHTVNQLTEASCCHGDAGQPH